MMLSPGRRNKRRSDGDTNNNSTKNKKNEPLAFLSGTTATATAPIPEEESLMSEAYEGDRIKVAVRLRPIPAKSEASVSRSSNPATCLVGSGLLLPRRVGGGTTPQEDSKAWIIQNRDTLIQKGSGRKIPKKNLFTMDHIYDDTVNTATIYESIARPIIQSLLSGRHGTVFAYGQTGSGKTYTMQGIESDFEDDAEEGLTQMAMSELFDAIESSSSRDWDVKVQYFEIYNEEVRDLIAATAPESPPRSSISSQSSSSRKKEKPMVRLPTLKVLEDRNGNVFVNAKEKSVTSAEECIRLLRKGNSTRSMAATDANQHSSRSHAIFRVTLHSRAVEQATGEQATARVSVLNFVDLAGSEGSRVTSSLTGSNALTRKREGCKINQSLLSLSRVIHSLSLAEDERPNHIGFRDSKLTRILQPSLSGNAAMAILCCASMAKSDLEETRSTLKFASSAKQIKIKPVVNEVVDDKEAFSRLQKELIMVKQALQAFQERFAKEAMTPEDAKKITGQPLLVGHITTAPTDSSVGTSEETPTMSPPAGSRASTSSPSLPAPRRLLTPPLDNSSHASQKVDNASQASNKLDESSESQSSVPPPVAEVQILDGRSGASLPRDDHLDEQRASYLEERIETTESLVERIYTELNVTRHNMLEASMRNADLREQVEVLQRELGEDDDSSSIGEDKTSLVSGWYFLFCVLLYAFGMRDFFISAVIFLWLSLQVPNK